VTVKSPALGARADASIYLPDQARGLDKVPVVILLHGVYGSHWIWAGMGKAHSTLQYLIETGEISPMILKMLSDGLWGDGSVYLNHSRKEFEKWIVDEVPRLVSEVTGNAFDTPAFIARLSMGGYGAPRWSDLSGALQVIRWALVDHAFQRDEPVCRRAAGSLRRDRRRRKFSDHQHAA